MCLIKLKYLAGILLIISSQLSGINYTNSEKNIEYFPSKFKTKPKYITLSNPLSQIFGIRKIKLDKFDEEILSTLNEDQLKELLLYLGDISIKIRWNYSGKFIQSKEGHCKKYRWNKINAGAALIFYLWANKQIDLVAKMISLAPEVIIPHLKGELVIILDYKVVSKSLFNLIWRVDNTNTNQTIVQATSIAKTYIENSYEKDDKEEPKVFANLIFEISKLIEGKNLSIKQKGILVGTMLSGAFLRAKDIKTKDEHRLWLVNSMGNMIWATTSFIGLMPVATSITTIIAGAASISSVLWMTIYGKDAIRDLEPKIREIEGYIEVAILDAIQSSDEDILKFIAWIHACIHVNGLDD